MDGVTGLLPPLWEAWIECQLPALAHPSYCRRLGREPTDRCFVPLSTCFSSNYDCSYTVAEQKPGPTSVL